jgi:hypothetical protein
MEKLKDERREEVRQMGIAAVAVGIPGLREDVAVHELRLSLQGRAVNDEG